MNPTLSFAMCLGAGQKEAALHKMSGEACTELVQLFLSHTQQAELWSLVRFYLSARKKTHKITAHGLVELVEMRQILAQAVVQPCQRLDNDKWLR